MVGAPRAALEKLQLDDWLQLENADSRDPTWVLDEVIEWLKSRVQDGKDESRDVDSLIRGFDLGNRIPASVMLFRKNLPPFLVAGSSRLLVARAKKLVPEILTLRSDTF